MRIETIIDTEAGTVSMILPKSVSVKEKAFFIEMMKGDIVTRREGYRNVLKNAVLKFHSK